MKFETIEVSGWRGAVRGMRNPLESWARSDSNLSDSTDLVLGPNDLDLMKRLINGGTEHRKFLRYIHVQVDITAPIYWWKEADTYRIGVTANSTSTMHKLASTPITLDCFETDDYEPDILNKKYTVSMILAEDRSPAEIEVESNFIDTLIPWLESLRQEYNETKDKRYWKELIRWIPESWLQTRTIDLNYEVLRTIVHQRAGHKLTEWHQFIDWVHTLPYADELIFS